MSREDEQLDAAEYVIGTLSGAERAAFEVLVSSDKQAQKDVSFWERTFGALNASVAPVIPAQHVWQKISTITGADTTAGDDSRIESSDGTKVRSNVSGAESSVQAAAAALAATRATAGGEVGAAVSLSPERGAKSSTKSSVESLQRAANDNVQRMKRSRSRWRWGAIAASLVAVALGVTTFNTTLRDNLVAKYLPGSALDKGKSYIAVVNTPDQPALIVKVNSKTGEVTVRSLGMNRPDGKSLELWYVPNGQKAVSVGLVGEGAINLGETAAKNGDLLAISLEPQGGSPTGTATGPIIYTGKLIEDIGVE